jgi:hypothetical protein
VQAARPHDVGAELRAHLNSAVGEPVDEAVFDYVAGMIDQNIDEHRGSVGPVAVGDMLETISAFLPGYDGAKERAAFADLVRRTAQAKGR